MKTNRLSAPFVITLLSLAIPALHAADAPKAAAPVAKIGTTVLSEDDLRKDMGMSLYEAENQLYQIKKGWVDQKAKAILMAQAAKEAGLSLAEWQKREIDKKALPPTELEIDQWTQRFSQQGSTTPPTPDQYKAMKEKAKNHLLQQRRQQRETEVYMQLTQKAGVVEVYFTKPDAPVVNVTLLPDDPSKGPKSAPVTIIEFTDFQCPYCKRSQETLNQVTKTYGDKVRIVEKQYPLPFHNRAKPAAEAALCAQEQGKFWEMHHKLFPSQTLESADFTRFATEIGLNVKKFETCVSTGKMSARVDKDADEGKRVGVRGTPHFFINGRVINGAQPFESFKTIIDEELAKKK